MDASLSVVHLTTWRISTAMATRSLFDRQVRSSTTRIRISSPSFNSRFQLHFLFTLMVSRASKRRQLQLKVDLRSLELTLQTKLAKSTWVFRAHSDNVRNYSKEIWLRTSLWQGQLWVKCSPTLQSSKSMQLPRERPLLHPFQLQLSALRPPSSSKLASFNQLQNHHK